MRNQFKIRRKERMSKEGKRGEILTTLSQLEANFIVSNLMGGSDLVVQGGQRNDQFIAQYSRNFAKELASASGDASKSDNIKSEYEKKIGTMDFQHIIAELEGEIQKNQIDRAL